MRILFLSQYFHPEQFLNSHIARALFQRGHSVDVICCVPNYPAGRFFEGYSNKHRREEIWHGITIHRARTIPRGRSSLQLLANYLTYPIAASLQMLRMKRKPADISFVSMPSPIFQALAGIFAAKVFRIPTVFWVQDIWPDSAIITLNLRNRLIIALLHAICGWIYRQGNLIMVQSDGFHEKIHRFGVDPRRIVTLPNTAPDDFRPQAPEDVPADIRRLMPSGRRTIMFAGNIGESQDFDTIIAAVASLPQGSDIVIVVIGSGRDEERVRRQVTEQGLEHRFVFLGRHPEKTMPAFFACADALLVSLRDEPIFALTVPSKIQAYLACGKPILASLAGEGAAIVEGAGAGIAVPPGQPDQLGRGMALIGSLAQPVLAEMGKKARETYLARFSLDAVTDALEAHLEMVLDGTFD